MLKFNKMRINKEERIIAVLGTITGIVPMDALCEFYKPEQILLWGYDGISKQVYDWSLSKGIKVKNYYPNPWTEENKMIALKEIAETADAIFLFHDYHPSSWVDYNSTERDTPLDRECLIVKEFGEKFNKRIVVSKLEKIFHHSFMISEEGERGGEVFDVPIPSRNMNEKTAKGEAMAKAQMYFINYICSPYRRRNADFYYLRRLEGRYWKEVFTHELKSWFKEIVERYSND